MSRLRIGQWWIDMGNGQIVEVADIQGGEVWSRDRDGYEKWHLIRAFLRTHDGPLPENAQEGAKEPRHGNPDGVDVA